MIACGPMVHHLLFKLEKIDVVDLGEYPGIFECAIAYVGLVGRDPLFDVVV
jgi:hypothetical protein